MQNSKLIGLLKVLSKEELERFRGFMQSPFFKKTTKAIALFEWIDAQKEHPIYQSSKLDVELIGKHLFSKQRNKALRKKSLSVVASELVGLIKGFLVQLKMEKEQDDYTYLLLESLLNRRAERDFWQTYTKTTARRAKSEITITHYYHQYLLEEACFNFQPTDKQLIKKQKKLKVDVYQVLNTLDVFVVLRKLQYCCFNWNTANIMEEEKNVDLANELISIIESKRLHQEILVHFYYLILLLLMNPNDVTYFFQLKGLLKNNQIPIHKRELRIFYTIASNYCNQKIKKGNDSFYQEMFDLYVLEWKQKLHYLGGFINYKFVKNIVSLGLNLAKTDWVSEFIEKTKNEIIPQYCKSVYSFNKGVLFFYTKNYSQALQVLLKVESVDVFYDLDYRGILLRCYYELQETDAFFSLTDSFRKFTKLQKISDGQKKSYLHFIRCVQRLYKTKIHPNPSKDSKDKIKQFILDIQPVNNQKWLLQKVEELL